MRAPQVSPADTLLTDALTFGAILAIVNCLRRLPSQHREQVLTGKILPLIRRFAGIPE